MSTGIYKISFDCPNQPSFAINILQMRLTTGKKYRRFRNLPDRPGTLRYARRSPIRCSICTLTQAISLFTRLCQGLSNPHLLRDEMV